MACNGLKDYFTKTVHAAEYAQSKYAMSLSWRALKQADLEECLAIDPRSTGEFIIGRTAALQVWRNLMQTRAFNSAVVEGPTRDGVRRILSFGASVFLTPHYAERVIRDPKPDCNSRVFDAIASGQTIIRSEASLVGDSIPDALDLLLLCSSFLHQALDVEQQVEVSFLLPHTLVHSHTGYRIRRILMETTNEPMRALAASSGIWKTLASFPQQNRAMMIVTQEEVKSSAGFTVLAPLFHYRAPRLGLRDIDKHLLAEAINGETDTELALRLHMSLSSVKKRWLSLFSRLAQTHPELLADANGTRKEDSRGLQKRHHILNYVRSHPEEIRPFRSYPNVSFITSKGLLSPRRATKRAWRR